MNRLFYFLTVVLFLSFTSCKYDDTEVWDELNDLADRVAKLEDRVNANIQSIQQLAFAAQNNDYIKSITSITEGGNIVGYIITFTKSDPVKIYHGKDGANGANGQNGVTPIIGVRKDVDDIYYWTLNGEWLLDDEGHKVKAVGVDGVNGDPGQNGAPGQNGTNGTNGENGVTPKLKIEQGKWYISYDEGASWTEVGQATGDIGPQGPAGEPGQNGDSFFKSVEQDENCVIFILADGTEIKVLKECAVSSVTLSYIPRYSDGKAALLYTSKEEREVEMDFQVMPTSAATIVANNWQTTLSLKAVKTQTRAVDYIELPISKCEADETSGVITITASGSNLAEELLADDATLRVALFYNTAKDGTISEFVELEVCHNAIFYTATKKITPNATSDFGANITSNEWDDKTGEGVILFDGNVKKIGALAFKENLTTSEKAKASLKSIIIPNSVTAIELSAFEKCYNLESLILPASLTTIGNRAFCFCEKLTTLTIPKCVVSIGVTPFAKCEGLQDIHFQSIEPPVITEETFSHTPATLWVNIPKGCRESYIKPDGWMYFTSIIREEGDEGAYKSVTYPQEDEVLVLQQATIGKGIDIVLIGDGFSDKSFDLCCDFMNKALDILFIEEPFKSFRNYFNVYAVVTVSEYEGYRGASRSKLGIIFDENGTHANPYTSDKIDDIDNVVLDYAQKAIEPECINEAMIIVVSNNPVRTGFCKMMPIDFQDEDSKNDWGSGWGISYIGLGFNDADFTETIIHENNGHSFAKLRDEYVDAHLTKVEIPQADKNKFIDEEAWGRNKNIDFTNDTLTVKWRRFIQDSTRYKHERIGMFPGAWHYGLGIFRPSETSIMNDCTGGFNAPSREAIYYRIHKLAYGKDWVYDYETFVQWDLNRSISTRVVPYRL